MAQSSTTDFPFLWPINTTWLFHFKCASGLIHCIWIWRVQLFNLNLNRNGRHEREGKCLRVSGGTGMIGFPLFIYIHFGRRPYIRPFGKCCWCFPFILCSSICRLTEYVWVVICCKWPEPSFKKKNQVVKCKDFSSWTYCLPFVQDFSASYGKQGKALFIVFMVLGRETSPLCAHFIKDL